MLILIVIIIAILCIVFIFIFYDELLDFITKRVDKTRNFINVNKSLIDIIFLLLYSVIQLVFIVQMSKPNANIGFLITLFVLSLLTIIGIERLFLKSRFHFLEDTFQELWNDYTLLEVDHNTTLEREKKLIKFIKRCLSIKKQRKAKSI